MVKATREMQHVVVEAIDGERTLITGGLLSPELAWIPDSSDIVRIGGADYLSIAFQMGGLAHLCFGDRGALRCNSFLDALIAARNRACEAAVDKVVAEVFGVATNYSRTKLRALRLRVLQEYASRLPATVEVQVPMEQERITAAFESDKRRRVAVKCDTETLNIIVTGVRESASCALRKKPRRQDAVRFDFPEVKMHQKREQPYVKWLDADGVCRYRFGRAKPEDDATPQDVHLQQEASELHEFFLANHHAPADAADDGANAAEDEGDMSPREG